ncbi:hypothetical protein [Mycobacteroides abscessus]|uniref:hypothetical protein n=1 Tax=Mycobacteroides abscessus TaxID=36809 RepID=UPI0009A73470|nr:hypothetical protein [Mycobacteroides abscessus]SKP38391.1 Uncharacterised protein [Mycobacteroides abscessus subsp. abscessus]
MSTIPDVQRPTDDPFGLLGGAWPNESENSYRSAAEDADDAAALAHAQAESADDAARRTDTGMQGKTADSLLDGYSNLADRLREQSITFTTIAAWTTDAAGKVEAAKRRIRQLAATGTSEIRDVLTSELQGTPASPSSAELTTKYRADIAAVKSTLDRDLDAIGHSLTGDPGSSTTPSYTSVPTAPSAEHADPRVTVAAYNHGQAPEVTPHQLPEMPRATPALTTESPSTTSIPSTPSAPHPTLSNLIGGQGTSTGTPSAASPGSTSTPHTSSQGSPSAQAHQSTEQHQHPKALGLLRIPSLPLDGLPVAAAESITTAVSSAVGHQLSTAAPSTITPSVPASTGFTPGVAGTSPVTPVTPGGLAPIGGGGGGLAAPPVAQPAPQASPAAPSPAPQQTPPPSSTRSPVVDAAWIQQRYGLAPGLDIPRPETPILPALFIVDLPESEAHLHRVLGALRQQFERSGWAQPLAVATLKKGFETRCVYVTADGVSIHPSGVLLPSGVLPLGEMPDAPTYPDLSGSIMVTEKLAALLPRGWEVESLLSTVPADENSQTTEQFQELVGAVELLLCKVSRGRGDVTAGEAMSTFARAALGSAGCSDLDVESSRLRSARWVGLQPSGYGEVLARWYLSDAAECIGLGAWGEAVYASERYLSITDAKYQVA